ncbi:MAG: sugar phosphate isomerase/epimerase, partial [Spirochaetaceae bacterium]
MKVGCFALIDPFATLEHQLDRIAGRGFKYADVTENSDGAELGVGYGFAAVASLDANPNDLRRMFEDRGLTITSYCAHALLLDPPAPWRYGTSQIIKAVRAAAAMGVSHVITTEGEAHTEYGKKLSEEQGVFTIAEKLYEPLRVAADFGVKILLEPHG